MLLLCVVFLNGHITNKMFEAAPLGGVSLFKGLRLVSSGGFMLDGGKQSCD